MSEVARNLIQAVREGNIQRATTLIDSYGLSHSPELSRGYTLLTIAVEKNHTALVNLLFSKGCSPIASGSTADNSPLLLAARNGNIEIVKQLLYQKADVNVKNRISETPLAIAVMRGCLPMVELFLENGAEVNESGNTSDNNPLHLAVRNYNFEIAKLLLKKGADANYKDKTGRTPLAIAIEQGCFPIVKLLLNCGADIVVSGADAPLHLAARNGTVTIVELLLTKGAAVNVKDKIGDTPLAIAVKKGKLLLKHDAEVIQDGTVRPAECALDLGTRKRAVQIAELFLKEGADVNAKNNIGETPLVIAVKRRCMPVTELLINYGADINAVDNFGRTVLHFAALDSLEDDEVSCLRETDNENDEYERRHNSLSSWEEDDLSIRFNDEVFELINLEIAAILISKGANVNAQTNAGRTSLHISIKRGKDELVDLLLRHNASVDLADNNGVTPLHIAAKTGNKGVTTKLLAGQANVDASSEIGWTALHLAVENDHKEIVGLLLESGALVNCIGTLLAFTPLHWVADKTGNKEICAMLLSRGPDVIHVTDALANAVVKEYAEVVKLLLESGANVNERGLFGVAALHYAVDPKIIETLLEFGAIIDLRSGNNGSTPLHQQACKYNEGAVATLLDHGADINVKCSEHKTPLDWTFSHYPSSYLENVSDDDFFNEHASRRLLLRHQVKMKAVGLNVVESRDSVRFEKQLEEFQNSCQGEVRGLENEFINGTNISYFDILRKDQRFLAKYMDDENVALAAESEEYRGRFPIYASMIKSRFRRGFARNKLLKRASRIVHSFIDLPGVCVGKFLDYLADEDLAVLASG